MTDPPIGRLSKPQELANPERDMPPRIWHGRATAPTERISHSRTAVASDGSGHSAASVTDPGTMGDSRRQESLPIRSVTDACIGGVEGLATLAIARARWNRSTGSVYFGSTGILALVRAHVVMGTSTRQTRPQQSARYSLLCPWFRVPLRRWCDCRFQVADRTLVPASRRWERIDRPFPC